VCLGLLPTTATRLKHPFERFGVLPEEASRFIEFTGARTVEDVALADEEATRQIIVELAVKPYTALKLVRAITYLKHLEAPKLELLSLFFRCQSCNNPLTCGANADATFTYSQVPLVASEAESGVRCPHKASEAATSRTNSDASWTCLIYASTCSRCCRVPQPWAADAKSASKKLSVQSSEFIRAYQQQTDYLS